MKKFTDFIQDREQNESIKDWIAKTKETIPAWVDYAKRLFSKPKPDYQDPFKIVQRGEDRTSKMTGQDQETYIDAHWGSGNLYQAIQKYNQLIEDHFPGSPTYGQDQITHIMTKTPYPRLWLDWLNSETSGISNRKLLKGKPNTLKAVFDIALFAQPPRGIGMEKPDYYRRPAKTKFPTEIPQEPTIEPDEEQLVNYIKTVLEEHNFRITDRKLRGIVYANFPNIDPRKHGRLVTKAIKQAMPELKLYKPSGKQRIESKRKLNESLIRRRRFRLDD